MFVHKNRYGCRRRRRPCAQRIGIMCTYIALVYKHIPTCSLPTYRRTDDFYTAGHRHRNREAGHTAIRVGRVISILYYTAVYYGTILCARDQHAGTHASMLPATGTSE